jgi:hypothetical protein
MRIPPAEVSDRTLKGDDSTGIETRFAVMAKYRTHRNNYQPNNHVHPRDHYNLFVQTRLLWRQEQQFSSTLLNSRRLLSIMVTRIWTQG